jgi:hypothetical protein
MKDFLFLGMLLAMLTFCHRLYAEGGCPSGFYPMSGQGWQNCVPIPNYAEQPRSGQNALPPPQRWEDRWGAVATDAAKGALGTASGVASEAIAEKVALKDCRSNGGAHCELQISYLNTCAAMVIGDRGYTVRTGRTLDLAIGYGEKASCSQKDQTCHVYYTDCSLPVRTQ